jgi:hypothetical protein
MIAVTNSLTQFGYDYDATTTVSSCSTVRGFYFQGPITGQTAGGRAPEAPLRCCFDAAGSL